MSYVTFNEMISLFGVQNAKELLRTIERMAEIKNDFNWLDGNVRLERAFRSLQEIPPSLGIIS